MPSNGLWFWLSRYLLIFLFTLSPPVVALAAATDWGQALVKDAALPQRLAPLPGFVERQVTTQLSAYSAVSPQMAQLVGSALSQAYNPASLAERTRRQLDQSMSASAMQRVDDWYRGTLGRKVVKVEVAASTAAMQHPRTVAPAALEKKYRGTTRAALFKRYDQALNATQHIVDTAIDAQIALAGLVPGQDPQQLSQRLTQQRPLLQSEVRDQVYRGYLYTYRTLTTEELRQYIAFLETNDARQFTGTVAKVAHAAVVTPIAGIAHQLQQLQGLQGLL